MRVTRLDLVDHPPVAVAHREVDPELALLAEARGHAVAGAGVLDLDRNREPRAAEARAAEAEAKGVAEQQIAALAGREREAVEVHRGLVHEGVRVLVRERHVDAGEVVRDHRGAGRRVVGGAIPGSCPARAATKCVP